MLALNSKGGREGVRLNRGLGNGRTSKSRESIAEIHYGPHPTIPFFLSLLGPRRQLYCADEVEQADQALRSLCSRSEQFN